MAGRGDEELLGVIANRTQSATERAAALMYYCRFQPSDRNALVARAAPKKNWRGALMDVCSVLETPLLLRELCWVYAGRMAERQAYLLPLAWDISKDEPWKLEDDPAIEDLMFGDLLAAAIDGHTIEGKRALASLLRRDKMVQSLATIHVTRPSCDLRAFHLTVFRTEGHLCRQRLSNAPSANVRQLCSTAMISHYCRGPDSGRKLLEYAPEILRRLNRERIRSLAREPGIARHSPATLL
jgi:hypothetical protein